MRRRKPRNNNNGGKATITLEQEPQLEGALVVVDNRSGQVLAMVGGFSFARSKFNRATQAQRQPGSTIKPLVYAAAMEQGLTPATIVNDAPFCVWQGAGLGNKCFRNFGNQRGAGPKTLRWGVEQSRNLMTVQVANQIGMDKVVDLIVDRVGRRHPLRALPREVKGYYGRSLHRDHHGEWDGDLAKGGERSGRQLPAVGAALPPHPVATDDQGDRGDGDHGEQDLVGETEQGAGVQVDAEGANSGQRG